MIDEKLRCDYCGKFIATDDFLNNKAERNLLSPASAFTSEDYETFHKACFELERWGFG